MTRVLWAPGHNTSPPTNIYSSVRSRLNHRLLTQHAKLFHRPELTFWRRRIASLTHGEDDGRMAVLSSATCGIRLTHVRPSLPTPQKGNGPHSVRRGPVGRSGLVSGPKWGGSHGWRGRSSRILKPRQKPNSNCIGYSRSPDMTATLACVSMMGFISELSLINMKLPAILTHEPHWNRL